MEFLITKEELLRPLQQVIGVVDKKMLQPVLSFVLLTFNDNELIISATDLDIQLCAKIAIAPQQQIGSVLLPGKKLFDICKLLPDNSQIKLSIATDKKYADEQVGNSGEDYYGKATLTANRSRFTLAIQDPNSFPLKQEQLNGFNFTISQQKLKNILNATAFAIATQDVRHYLLGMLWEFTQNEYKAVATDGHRLAMASFTDEKISPQILTKIIMPRKSVMELIRLLEDNDNSDVFINITERSAQIETNDLIFTTKLLSVQFPDYRKVFPSTDDSCIVEIEKDQLKQILSRVSILSNEKHRAVRLCFSENQLVIATNNPEQEQAEELIEVSYTRDPLEICFNIGYLIDVLNKITTDKIKLQLKQANTPALLAPAVDQQEGDSQIHSEIVYIIMPMSL